MKRLLLAAVFGCLVGCVTSTPEERVASWNGEKADRLVAVWGKPSAVDQGPGGAKTYVYQVQESRLHVVEGGPRSWERFEREDVECTVRFNVDQSNTVRAVVARDNELACDHTIEANPNQLLAH